MKIVTSEDFKIKAKKTKPEEEPEKEDNDEEEDEKKEKKEEPKVEYEDLTREEVKKIFPPYTPSTGSEFYIDFVRLRPHLSETIPGEKIQLTCTFALGCAREDGAFNVTGTCSYGGTPDRAKIETELAKCVIAWQEQYSEENSTEMEKRKNNWRLLEAKRHVIEDSFDFVIETLGMYTNKRIMQIACIVIIEKLDKLDKELTDGRIAIKKSDNLLPNCFDITLENEDYTLGNILNYELYQFYGEIFDYVGFKKMHPHDTNSILKLSVIDKTQNKKVQVKATITTYLQSAIFAAKLTLTNIKELFREEPMHLDFP